jgi:hypothetical protein
VSIIQNIALRLISKKEVPKSKKQFLNWKQVKRVLLIAYDNQLADLVEFVNTCKRDSIDVLVAIIYNGKAEQAPKPHFDHLVLDKKQFSFLGLPTNDCLQQLNAKSFDVLINLGSSSQIKALAVSKLVPATCKISSFQDPIFDLSIDSDTSLHISDYLKQVVVYLNMIKNKIQDH